MTAPRKVSAVVVHDGTPGGARTYAEWTAADLGVHATDPAGIDPGELVVASTVIVFCGIDGVDAGPGAGEESAAAAADTPGIRFVLDDWEALVGSGRRVCVAMVSAAPVVDDRRMRIVTEVFPPEQLRELKFFQLRGAVDTSGLGLRQRMAVKAMVAQIRARSRRTPDEQAMLDNGGELDFTDRASLGPLLRWARELG